jgi:hypothetical protein
MFPHDDAHLRLRHERLKEQIAAAERRFALAQALAGPRPGRRPHHRALARLGDWLIAAGGRLRARYAEPTAAPRPAPRANGRATHP